MRIPVMTLAVMFALFSPLSAEVRFANIFNDNMVLQRDKPIRVWGWADPGAKIGVTLTEDPTAATPYLPKKESLKEPPKPDTKYSVSLQYVEKNAPPFKPQTVEVPLLPDWSEIRRMGTFYCMSARRDGPAPSRSRSLQQFVEDDPAFVRLVLQLAAQGFHVRGLPVGVNCLLAGPSFVEHELCLVGL